jgi:16S rRNA (adenine(1408)-N(1))-methyltransferase
MIVVRGRKLDEIDPTQLDALLAPYDRTAIDVGAGDGRFAYNYARAHPDTFVIAMDPVREAMREMSTKSARKPERGGIPNVLYVLGSIEQPPEELQRRGDDIHVTLPWGSLMRGIVLADPPIISGLASLAKPGARLRIILNTRIFDDPVPIEAQDLPEVTPDYVRSTLAPAYAQYGIRIEGARDFDADEFGDLATTWAKRLAHRSAPRSVLIEATCIER